jgi:restriction endonuclease S subunit
VSGLFFTRAGWEEVRLAEICALVPGAPTHDEPDGPVPVLKPRNLIGGRLAGPTDRISAEEAVQRHRYQVRADDILCARTGSIGKVGLAAIEQEGWIFGTGLICMRPSEQVDPEYLSFYFTHPAVADWIVRHARGTAIPSIGSRVLGTLPVSLPPLSTQQAIGHAVKALNDKIEAHRQICDTTAELRDALLPLLFSGQLSVREGLASIIHAGGWLSLAVPSPALIGQILASGYDNGPARWPVPGVSTGPEVSFHR